MSALAAGSAAVTRLALLADPTDVGDETHKGGPFAILVIAVLCVVCFFLFRSMSKHLRRVREAFPEGAGHEGAGPDGAGPDGAGPDGATVDAVAAPPTATDAAVGTPAARPAAPGSVRPAPKSRARTDHPADR